MDLVSRDVIIDDGVITKIAPSAGPGSFTRRIDGSGSLLLPGPIDVHAHVYDPDYTYREDYASGTKSALLGGVTCVIDMPLVNFVDSAEKVKKRRAAGEADALIDFAIHAGFMNSENLNRVDELATQGVLSYKTFTCPPFEADWQSIMALMKRVARLGGIVNLHAEDGALIRRLQTALQAAGRRDPLAFHESRTADVEARAVRRAARVAAQTGCRVHISHMSSESGVRLVSEAKALGVQITAETCPQYLVFTRKDVERLGPFLKMAPGLKSERDQVALWGGLESGKVDLIATDHAPCPPNEKEAGWSDIWQAWGGVPGIATMVPLLITHGLNAKRLSLASLYRILCSNPARVFGLKNKGRIRVGYDADLTLIDVKRKDRVDASRLYKVGWSPYDGWELAGWPKYVIAKGEVLLEDSEVVSKPGRGTYVRMTA